MIDSVWIECIVFTLYLKSKMVKIKQCQKYCLIGWVNQLYTSPDGSELECSLWDWEVVGSNPDRIPAVSYLLSTSLLISDTLHINNYFSEDWNALFRDNVTGASWCKIQSNKSINFTLKQYHQYGFIDLINITLCMLYLKWYTLSVIFFDGLNQFKCK